MINESFVLYTSIREVLEELTDEQKGKLFQAIIDYECGEQLDIPDMVVKMAFIPIRQMLDRNNEKWTEEKKKRSEAGKKGMEKRWGNKNAITPITNDNNVISVNNKDNKNKSTTKFTPPTVEEVRAYCEERGNNVNAEAFIDFYESKGWYIGKNKVKNWKACVRTWEQRSTETRQTTPKTTDINDYLMAQAMGADYGQTGSF